MIKIKYNKLNTRRRTLEWSKIRNNVHLRVNISVREKIVDTFNYVEIKVDEEVRDLVETQLIKTL